MSNPQYAYAARRIGVSVEEYAAKRKAGLKWCAGCREWHPGTREYFGQKSKRPGDGLRTHCYVADRNRNLARRMANGQKKPREPERVLLNEPKTKTKRLSAAHYRAERVRETVPVGVSAPRVTWIRSQF